jgi:hypothetical protein
MDDFKGEPKIVDIERIQPNDWNPKDSIEESDFNKTKFEEIKLNLQKKKQYMPILVRRLSDDEKKDSPSIDYQIVDGYHRWLAAKELGWPKILVWDLGQISKEEAKGITLDAVYLQVPASEVLIAKVVSEVAELGEENLQYLPYPKDKIEEYLKMAEFDWEKLETGSEGATGELHKVICPKCGYEFVPKERI